MFKRAILGIRNRTYSLKSAVSAGKASHAIAVGSKDS